MGKNTLTKSSTKKADHKKVIKKPAAKDSDTKFEDAPEEFSTQLAEVALDPKVNTIVPEDIDTKSLEDWVLEDSKRNAKSAQWENPQRRNTDYQYARFILHPNPHDTTPYAENSALFGHIKCARK